MRISTRTNCMNLQIDPNLKLNSEVLYLTLLMEIFGLRNVKSVVITRFKTKKHI